LFWVPEGNGTVEERRHIVNRACDHSNVPEEMSEVQKERAIHANKVFCKACEENGLKVCSWENFSAWKEFVDGKIGENQLVEQAEDELKQFRDTFQKYTIVSSEEVDQTSKEKDVRNERAKLANKLYKKACTDSGMNNCFFKDFGTWSDYVHGKIGETEFLEKAEMEVKKMVAEAN
jgi:hypothetical protein